MPDPPVSSATPTAPYGSVRDLPSFRELDQQLSAFKLLQYFIGRKHRAELRELQQQMDRLASVVDRFYEILGPRNWIFHDSLNLSLIEDILDHATDPQSAETRLIETYRNKETSIFWLRRLQHVDGLSQRFNQILRARDHYDADQFDSCALHLIAVMEGFVNDFQPAIRRGLSSRNPDDMIAWDHVVGHHLGLTNALKAFTKTVKKRVDHEVFELHRHGIVHGSLTNYNNVVVATKAWNMLYAVVDWTKATRESQKPTVATPSWHDLVHRHRTNRRIREQLAAWHPKLLYRDFDGFEEHGVFRLTTAFLTGWRDSNFGVLAGFADRRRSSGTTVNRLAGEMRGIFEFFDLTEFEITELENKAPVIWIARGTAVVNGKTGAFECRWTREIDDGGFDERFDTSPWRLVFCDPSVWRQSRDAPV